MVAGVVEDDDGGSCKVLAQLVLKPVDEDLVVDIVVVVLSCCFLPCWNPHLLCSFNPPIFSTSMDQDESLAMASWGACILSFSTKVP